MPNANDQDHELAMDGFVDDSIATDSEATQPAELALEDAPGEGL